ncbi:MAG: ABC transporter permease [Deltaproteobacteria bacterium]|nr:MAG: ABC transporter permease [Deltaproteobacteria bacterium]RLB78869.1 MAG: ABC transporter permease [Deltaproteobacteria bacterium]
MSLFPKAGGLRRSISDLVRVFNRNKTSWFGLVLLLFMVTLAVFAPWISPYDPIDQDILHRLSPASAAHWLGTDHFGRDILSRILWGARISLSVGTISVLMGMTVGTVLGILAGYKGKYWDYLIMGVMDVFMAIPTLLMGLMVVAVLGPNLVNLTIAIALTVAPRFARIARAPTLSIKNRDYIEAGRAMGFSELRIMAGHIFPNILGELIVMGSLWVATAVRIEASLSFIGLGVKPPTPTWGGMIREGFQNILSEPWVSVYPGIFILITVLAFNMLGDGLRDAIDPKLRNS